MGDYFLSIEIDGQTLYLTKDFGYESVPHRAQLFSDVEEIELFLSQSNLFEKNPKVYKLLACEEVALPDGSAAEQLQQEQNLQWYEQARKAYLADPTTYTLENVEKELKLTE